MNNSRKISGLLFLFCFLMSIVLALFLSFASDTAAEKKIEGKPLPMEHSTLLSIYDCNGYSVVDVKNPWGEGLLRRYVLVPKGSQLPEGLPEGVLLRTPLDRVVVILQNSNASKHVNSTFRDTNTVLSLIAYVS